MAKHIIPEEGKNIYAHIRDSEYEHLQCLFELSIEIFERGKQESWISLDDYNYFLTLLPAAKELQREGLQRLIGLTSRYVIVGRENKRLPGYEYVQYSYLLEELSSMIRNELDMYYGKPRV